MRQMKLFAMALSTATCVGGGAAYAEPLPSELEKSIRDFVVVDKALEGGVLKVALGRSVVNQETYSTFIRLGVCSPLWLDAKRGWGNAKIDRVEVLNRSKGQGFAFIGGRASCTELGRARGADAAQRYLAEHSWVCVAGFECRPRRPGEKTSGDE